MTVSGPPIWSSEYDACTAKVDHLFQVFAAYRNSGRQFCDFCYTPDEVRQITQTPLAELDEESGRKLLGETADHWESADVYRHFLPRILQFMGPPWFVEDLYPAHLFETLLALGFRRWPNHEQAAVIEFLECVGPHLRHSEIERVEWATGLAVVKKPEGALPSEAFPDAGDA